jgi:formylglycine-generating enzyme
MVPEDGSTGDGSSTGVAATSDVGEASSGGGGEASSEATSATTGAVDPDSSGEPPDPSTSTGGEPTTDTTAAETSSDTTDASTTDSTCEAACGTPNCGTCPDANMVAFPGFWIDATEVTNDQYSQFLEAAVSPDVQTDACAWNTSFKPEVWPPAEDGQLPVVHVDWCDAHAFCAWAGKRLCGKIGGGPASVLDIVNPTKNQWYRACSGGLGNLFPYGDSYVPTACNGMEAGVGQRVPAGSVKTCEGSAIDLFDMSGNVFEWVDSCASDDPAAPCLRRGGSFFSDAETMQCNLKSERARSDQDSYVGLRCCQDE